MIKSEWVGLFTECKSAVASKIVMELSRLKINIKNINITRNGLKFSVKKGDRVALKDIENAYSVKFVTYKNYGASWLLNTVKLKAGLIVGVILGIVAVVILSNYTLGIKINCDQEIYYGKIEQTLQKSGLKRGLPLSKVDSQKLETEIMNNLEESVFATVHVNGVVVYVDVVTVPLTDEYPNDKKNIKSEYQGIVTRVVVNSGTAVVKQGDSVKAGDILIDGYVNVNKDDYQTPEQIVKQPVSASGEVYAKVFYHKRIYLADQTLLTRRTGKQKTLRQLFLGKTPIGKPNKPPYDLYETVTTYAVINVLAPINVVTVTYFEIESYTLDKEAYRETSIVMAREEIMEKLPYGAKIIKEQIIETSSQNNAIDFYIEVEQRIDDGGHNYSYAR